MIKITLTKGLGRQTSILTWLHKNSEMRAELQNYQGQDKAGGKATPSSFGPRAKKWERQVPEQ